MLRFFFHYREDQINQKLSDGEKLVQSTKAIFAGGNFIKGTLFLTNKKIIFKPLYESYGFISNISLESISAVYIPFLGIIPSVQIERNNDLPITLLLPHRFIAGSLLAHLRSLIPHVGKRTKVFHSQNPTQILIVIILGVIVGFVAISLIMPLYDLTDNGRLDKTSSQYVIENINKLKFWDK